MLVNSITNFNNHSDKELDLLRYTRDDEILETTNEQIKLKLGHIGAAGTLSHEDKMLNVSLEDLYENGIIDERIDIEISSRPGCGYSFEGAAVAAEMFYKQEIRAFIGPYCSSELDVVAKMASFWNVPVISYAATSGLIDKTIHRTLARVSFTNMNSIAEAVAALLAHYKWFKVAIATNTGAIDRVLILEQVLKRRQITVVKKVIFEMNSTSEEMIASGLISQLRSSARIIICSFSSMLQMSREFMAATYNVGMHSNDFVYILPWSRDGKVNSVPWVGTAGETMQRDNIYSYLHIYDALILYAYAVRALLNETNDPSALSNGKLIWNKMRRVKFEGGTTGSVIMDDLADRVPNLAAFYVPTNGKKILKIVNMSSKLRPNCDGILSKFGCYDLLVTDVITGFWPSHDALLPLDEPICGFRDEKCSYLIEIISGSTLIALVMLILLSYYVYRCCESRTLRKMPWRIYKDDVKILDDEQLKSLKSIGSSTTRMSESSIGQKKHALVGVNTHVTYHLYPQRRPIKFGREDLKLLSQMKAAIHDNLNTFIGLVFNQGENVFIIWKFCSRGTIQDIIYNQNLTLDEKFHAAFVRDITQGLEYLHTSPIGYHGSLSPWACLIDRNWMVKLTDFGIANSIERWEKQGWISQNALTSDDDRSGPTQRTSVLYCAPEMLKNREINRRSIKDEDWKKQSKIIRQAGDIYSFGMVMYEILFRSLPYPENININELVDTISDGSRTFPPRIIHSRNVHPDLCALLEDCWSENLEVRPTIRRVQLNTKRVLEVRGSLVDQMMSVMEQYATNLEKLVADRTAMLEDANTRTDKLLSQLLPPYVANELKLGHSVPPKLFEMATVLFSDIVGFTNICSSSTPLEVVTMLNGLYSGFDECINRSGAYKVETIGDAYMVVSGIPEENGTKHIQCIADVALDMRDYLNTYQIPHRSDKLQCRWGFHTGPAAAGVVGLTSPRYCLFGDTVNEASRMESTSFPGKIQISSDARNFLMIHYPFYACQERGKIEIKGKGVLQTYWLEKKLDDQSTIINNTPSDAAV
ncbi:RGC/RGC protein kinase [Loa loa]|uniref:Guanylate cyclase n=1 Tax=Loa loa TaxID=7209 RepID=A0A1S0U1Y2_LOALO|nr:RGC/RGC protein kinase [Loa loa]EFO23835.2 RGC/RGC protein kinase [Loa loa]